VTSCSGERSSHFMPSVSRSLEKYPRMVANSPSRREIPR
jgi:hypothetical protein